jgi:hypothetical protein
MQVSGQLHASASLPPRKETLVPIGYEAGWVPEPVWTRWWREVFLAPTGTRTPDVLLEMGEDLFIVMRYLILVVSDARNSISEVTRWRHCLSWFLCGGSPVKVAKSEVSRTAESFILWTDTVIFPLLQTFWPSWGTNAMLFNNATLDIRTEITHIHSDKCRSLCF